jgi:hypothetical protein
VGTAGVDDRAVARATQQSLTETPGGQQSVDGAGCHRRANPKVRFRQLPGSGQACTATRGRPPGPRRPARPGYGHAACDEGQDTCSQQESKQLGSLAAPVE